MSFGIGAHLRLLLWTTPYLLSWEAFEGRDEGGGVTFLVPLVKLVLSPRVLAEPRHMREILARNFSQVQCANCSISLNCQDWYSRYKEQHLAREGGI
jgi:hypothetical protein